MPTTVRPRGPLPARVYWTRRIIVLAVPLLLVVVIARFLGGSADGKDESTAQATQAGATTAATTAAPTAGPTSEVAPGAGKKGGNGKKNRTEEVVPPEPVLAEPTGPCTESDIVAT